LGNLQGKRVPLQWALTQNNLGNALGTLGERESGTQHLTEAVAAFNETLKVWTRERVPLDWAITQNNLGRSTAGPRNSHARRERALPSAGRPHQWLASFLRSGAALRFNGCRRYKKRRGGNPTPTAGKRSGVSANLFGDPASNGRPELIGRQQFSLSRPISRMITSFIMREIDSSDGAG
jgi:hypothetical protein